MLFSEIRTPGICHTSKEWYIYRPCPSCFWGDGSWEIGCHVGCKHTGKGYASEAVKAFLPVIMKRLGITEMKGICALDNLSSMRVMEKNGFSPSYRLLDQKEKNYVYYLSPLDGAVLL